MIPYDTKNYRARSNLISTSGYTVIGIIMIVILLAWMGERDREAVMRHAQVTAAAQCNK